MRYTRWITKTINRHTLTHSLTHNIWHFFTAKVMSRTRFSVTLHVHCLSCCFSETNTWNPSSCLKHQSQNCRHKWLSCVLHPMQRKHDACHYNDQEYLNTLMINTKEHEFLKFKNTSWFKYDRDDLWVNKSQFVLLIFEPPCMLQATKMYNTYSVLLSGC